MAAYVKNGAGSWQTSSLWTPNGVPGEGDTATIGYSTSIDSNTVIGAAGATGTAAITITAGTLTINAPLTLKGDLIQAKGTTVTNTPGSGSMTFTPPSGSTYKWGVGASGTGVPIVNLQGTSGTKFNFATTQGGGGNAYIEPSTGVSLTIRYFEMVYFGNASKEAYKYTTHWNTSPVVIENGIFRECGNVWIGWTSSLTTTTFIVDGVDFRNSLSSEIFRFYKSYASTGGTHRIKNITSYQTTAKSGVIVSYNTDISNIISYNTSVASLNNYSASDISNLFVIFDQVLPSNIAVGPSGGYAATIKDSLGLSHVSNPHYIVSSGDGGIGPNIYTGWVFDGDNYFSSDAGDLVTSVAEFTLQYSLNINKAGTLGSHLNTTGVGNYINNTSYHSMGVTVGETTGGAAQLKNYYNNLTVAPYLNSDGSSAGDGIHQDNNFISQTSVTLFDYNASHGAMRVTALVYPVGHPYAGEQSYMGPESKSAWFNPPQTFGTDYATHDLVVNPSFSDATRTIRSYTGAEVWATIQVCAREMVTINGYAYDGATTTATTITIQDILDGVRAGFTPSNIALRGTGFGGTYIGAVEPIIGTAGAITLFNHFNGGLLNA